MNVLLVDNKSAHLERLKLLIAEYLDGGKIQQIVPEELDDKLMKWADVVILSGGQGKSIIKNRSYFGQMVETIERHDKPTIGICLGAEALAVYFGAELELTPVRRVGNVRIIPVGGTLDLPDEGVMVYEFHRWNIVPKLPSQLVEVARSKDGIEIFKHKKYPIWGLQFHPEVKIRDNSGHEIFGMLLEKLGLLEHAR